MTSINTKHSFIHNTISLSCHEQVCLISLRFERYFSHHQASDEPPWSQTYCINSTMIEKKNIFEQPN